MCVILIEWESIDLRSASIIKAIYFSLSVWCVIVFSSICGVKTVIWSLLHHNTMHCSLLFLASLSTMVLTLLSIKWIKSTNFSQLRMHFLHWGLSLAVIVWIQWRYKNCGKLLWVTFLRKSLICEHSMLYSTIFGI